MLLGAIVESSDDAIVSKTLNGIIILERGAQRCSVHAEEAVGKSILLIVPPERHGEERNILDRLGRVSESPILKLNASPRTGTAWKSL